MKNKPQSHRKSNTFRFEGFYAKVKKIKISARSYILQKSKAVEDAETFLWQMVCDWRDKNLTVGFQKFQEDLGNAFQTIAQLLLNEAHIADTIEEHLCTADLLALPPILHSLVAFARDTPQSFYENHFGQFAHRLSAIVASNPRCHETIENVFVCFVSLFTLLHKYISNDFYSLYVKNEVCALLSKNHPWYVNELCAQSIGSLIRKFPSKEKNLTMILKRLKRNKNETEGVGRLLFHAMKSDAARRLHTSTPTLLSILFDLILREEVPLEESKESIAFCLRQLLAHATSAVNIPTTWQETWKQDAEYVWPVIFDKFKALLKDGSHKSKAPLSVLLSFLYEVSQFRYSALVTDFTKVIEILTAVTQFSFDDEIGRQIAQIAAKLLISTYYDAASSTLREFFNVFFSAPFSPAVGFYFVDLVLDSNLFENEILPSFLRFVFSVLTEKDRRKTGLEGSELVHKEKVKERTLNTLVNIINSNVPPIRTATDLDSWSVFSLDLTQISDLVDSEQNPLKILIDSVFTEGLVPDASNLEDIIKCCLCLPHISPLDTDEFIPFLFWIMNDALDRIQKHAVLLFSEDPEPKMKKKRISSRFDFNISLMSDETSRKLIFLSSVIVETLHHLIPHADLISTLAGQECWTLLKENPHYRENIHLLKIIDIHLTVLATEQDSTIVNEETLSTLYPVLAPSLASHKPLVRLLVSHIFSLFPLKSSLYQKPDKNLFITMFEIESCPISPLEYKERLRLLSDLDLDRLNDGSFKLYQEAPILFLIGQLYINFKEIWPPCLKMIAKYANTIPEDVFWPIWLPQLKIASHFALRKLCDKELEEELTTEFSDPTLKILHSDLISHPGCSHLISKTDYLHFRDLLWQAMHNFPEICERRNKDVVLVFMVFLHKEFFPADYSIAPTQDVSIHSEETEGGVDSSRSAETVEGDAKLNGDASSDSLLLFSEEETIDARHRVRRAPINSLCEHLTLFAKFHNPKVIFKSKELETVYYEFLSHPYPKAQKLSMDAIMTYNHKYLMPYRGFLFGILDDEAFKNEITLFDIEGKGEDESKSLKAEHRKDFMPVLMRILYGKMQYKTGGHTSGKSKISSRKEIVLRFLAGANEEELDTFLNLSFDIMLSHLEGDSLEIVKKVEQDLDPKRVIPLKRMMGALGTLETIFKKIGSLLENKRPFMLKVILLILSTSGYLHENRAQVCSHFFPMLKSIRHAAMLRVVGFFENFIDYRWTSEDLEAVFRAAVWPNLKHLPDEGIYSPTPLLRLFCCWANRTSYHILLARYDPKDPSLTPMPFLLKLVNHRKCSSSVRDVVYTLIEILLKKPEDLMDVDEESAQLPLDSVLPLINTAAEAGFPGLSRSEALVFSCLEELLVNIKNNLAALKQGQVVKNRDLAILMHLSQWITKEEDAHELLDSVVPILKKRCVKQNDKIQLLLETCTKLVTILEKPEEYSSDFIFLFSIMNGRAPRASLCRVIEALYSGGEESKMVAKWASEMNAWSYEMVEEIDTDTRLRCYKEVNGYLKEMETLNEELVLFLVYQNVWVLTQEKTQAFMDLSILCLENLLETLVRFQPNSLTAARRIMDNSLLPLLKSGLRNPSEIVRNAVMTVIRFAVQKCHTCSTRLHDLYKLSDTNDPDADFFAAMAHLQRGKRIKALIKLSENLNQGVYHFQTETLNEYLLPIASIYLFKEEYAADANLLTSCVQCIGAIAKQLPWYHYQKLLKQYLNLASRELSQLKLGVRVLEVVIDAFHENIVDKDEIKELDVGMNEIPQEVIGDSGADNDAIGKKGKEEDEDDNDADDDIDEEENEKGEVEEMRPYSVSLKSRSLKVYQSLTGLFIPRIHNILSQKSVRDTEHKVNKKKYPEDEDIKRIPLALALIKLLKKLPKKMLDLSVGSVLMKLIAFLKSRAESIRREARNMLVKVMEELGGEYLPVLVGDLKDFLIRGYQSHVMVYSLHAILTALQPSLSSSHIGPCLSEIMDICLEDLFGDKAEEKDVSKLSNKVREVRADKGYAIMGLVSHVIAIDQLEIVIVPLRHKLQTQDKKIVNKVISCLQKIGNALEKNENISVEHKSVFIYGILKDKIKELSRNADHNKPKEASKSVVKDCLIIAPEPRRDTLLPKTSHKVTGHVLIEFALNFLFHLVRHDRFIPSDKKHLGLLDAYVAIISDCLVSDYPEVSIQALHVIGHLVRFPLPSLKAQLPKICGRMFVILNKFSSSGFAKGKLFELVQLDFKIIALIIKEVSFYKLDLEHAKVLLFYARNNLDDFNQYHSSFVILHAIIQRKIHFDELHALMETIKEMSIKSTNLNMLDQARKTYLIYESNYPKKIAWLQKLVVYYANNVSYEIPEGRLSAAIMLNDLITKLPRKVFDHSVEVTVWFKLSEQIVRETSKEHKELLHKILKSLFIKSNRKTVFIDNCLKLLDDDLMKTKVENSLIIHMSAQSLFSLLDAPANEHPSSVFETVLPKIASLLHPTRYEFSIDTDVDVSSHEARCLDLSLNSLLNLFSKLMDCYMTKKNLRSWSERVGRDVWKYMQDHLLYPNLNVRLSSAIILGKLFAMYPVEQDQSPPIAATPQMAQSLVIDLCEQLNTECSIESPHLTQLGMAVARNIVYLIRQSRKVPLKLNKFNRTFLTEVHQEMLVNDEACPEDQGISKNEENRKPFKRKNYNSPSRNEILRKSRKNLSDQGESNSTSSKTIEATFLESNDIIEKDSYIDGIYWLLHRVGVMAYNELRTKGKTSTFRRESLLNLIAGVIVVLDKEFETANNLVSFVVSHLTRELLDKSLPEPLAIRTKEVAELVREKIGIERCSEETLRVKATLEAKRTERKAKTRERIMSDPMLALAKKAKKQAAKKESRKRKLKELKLKPSSSKRLRSMVYVTA